MSRSKNSRSAKRSLGTFVALLLVPAAAVAVLSVGLGTAVGDTAPSGLLLAESRATTFAGENLASTPSAAPAEAKNVDEILSDWQNTVRHRARSRR